jgi:hypothetical protein
LIIIGLLQSASRDHPNSGLDLFIRDKHGNKGAVMRPCCYPDCALVTAIDVWGKPSGLNAAVLEFNVQKFNAQGSKPVER